MRWAFRYGLIVVALATSGCVEFDVHDYFDLKKNIPWTAGENGEQKPPMKIAAIWTDTILNQAGQPSMRGFGGRLMFYAVEGGKPIKVKGTLTVYAFDESTPDPTKVRPDRKYVFTAEQFEKHYSKSALGHSYSVWLPWDEAGGPMREIGLLVRFTPENGPAVVGDESKQVLPGFSEKDPTQYPEQAVAPAAAPMPTGAVQPVSYQEPMPGTTIPAASPGGSRRMSTTTISLPGGSGLRAPTGAASPPSNHGSAVGPSPWQATQSRTSEEPVWANRSEPASTAAAAAALPGPVNSATVTPPATAAAQSLAHYGPSRRRPLGEPLSRLERDHAPWQPSR